MKSPAFQFYPKDWLSSRAVRMMDAEQRGWYIQLLAEAWEGTPQNSLPDDPELLKKLAGAESGDAEKFAFVLSQFVSRRGKRYHPRLMVEMDKQKRFKEVKSQAGKNGAVRRWHSHTSAIPLPSVCHASANGKTMADDSFASASAIATAVSTTTICGPSLKEVLEKAKFIGCPEPEAEKFWHHFESSGWIDKNGNPVVSWESKLSTWTATARAAPLEKAHHTNGSKLEPRDDYWKNSKQLEQVESAIRAIEARGSQTAMELVIEERDRQKYATLRTKRKDLKKLLGL